MIWFRSAIPSIINTKIIKYDIILYLQLAIIHFWWKLSEQELKIIILADNKYKK